MKHRLPIERLAIGIIAVAPVRREIGVVEIVHDLRATVGDAGQRELAETIREPETRVRRGDDGLID